MEPFELLALLAAKLESMELSYFVTGSIATIFFGEPRLTNDIDVVVEIEPEDAARMARSFPAPEFYCSEEAIKSAVESRRQFNIIHIPSAFKFDVMVPEESEFNNSRFQRKLQLELPDGTQVWFASPEDVILKKLDYYLQGGSDKHIRDILGVLRVHGKKIDRDYIRDWAIRLELLELWQSILDALKKNA